ncbi:MAG: hypothetical protein L0271_23860, partial [Gemmatimonadetes bacterium]|nr:hypothetical protein [Gemmatimonadota bacterium]
MTIHLTPLLAAVLSGIALAQDPAVVVVSAASGSREAVAPDSIITIAGQRLATAPREAQPPLPLDLAGTTVA